MSVLINMEVPTSCRECWLKINCDDCEGWECYCLPLQTEIGYLKDLLTDKRRDDCPLVPVPPHGRLIDADELLRSNKSAFFDIDGYPEFSYEAVIDAPTIIPASKEGK